MSKPERNKSRVRREVEALLKATGRTWRIEEGTKHNKIFVDDQFVGIISRGDAAGHDCKKIAAKIRRICR